MKGISCSVHLSLGFKIEIENFYQSKPLKAILKSLAANFKRCGISLYRAILHDTFVKVSLVTPQLGTTTQVSLASSSFIEF